MSSKAEKTALDLARGVIIDSVLHFLRHPRGVNRQGVPCYRNREGVCCVIGRLMEPRALHAVGGSHRIDLSDSVYNEWLCARLLEALGLSVADSEVLTFEDQQALVVERFDRQMMADERWIARLPQGDFCQALGLPPTKKYEVDGGANMTDCLRLIDGSSDASGDRIQFQLAQLGFWLMAACDGHAKKAGMNT